MLPLSENIVKSIVTCEGEWSFQIDFHIIGEILFDQMLCFEYAWWIRLSFVEVKDHVFVDGESLIKDRNIEIFAREIESLAFFYA